MASSSTAVPTWVKDEGFTTLADPESPIADVVFIHGLQGNPRRTWRYKGTIEKQVWTVPQDDKSPASRKHFWKKKEKTCVPTGCWKTQTEKVSVNWPAELLPLDFGNVRILTYGYDSCVTKYFRGSANQSNIDSFGRDFLSALEGVRRFCPTRPLIFVAHSLGGIIVKEALRRSRDSCHQIHLRTIYDHVSAIMFFGTPHRGSPDGGWGIMLRNIAKAALFDTNPQILRDLDSMSLTGKLDNLNEALSDMLLEKDFMITTFQESQGKVATGILGLNSKIVPDFSSALDDRKHEIRVSMNANHMEMCRFGSRTDPGYEKFTQAFSLHLNAVHRGHSDEIKACMQSLNFEQIHHRKIEIIEAESSTFRWIFNQETSGFVKWLTGGRQIFWICGKPGSGKSTMMKFLQSSTEVTDVLKKSPYGGDWVVLAFYFTFKGTRLEKTLEGLLRSFLLQLIQKVPGLGRIIKRHGLIDTNIGPTFVWELETLKQAFKDAMSSNRAKVCLLVDALDEFEGSMPELVNLLKEIEQNSGFTRSTIKICVASRPHANIILELEQSQRLRMEDCNHEDISRFVQQRLGPLLSSHVNKLDFPRLSEAIIKKAEGVFLWASFAVMDLIEGFSYGDTAEDLERRLNEMPPDMENIYRRILRNVNQRYKLELMLMLQIVCRSTAPLTVDQLACALSVGMFPTEEEDQSKYACQTSSLTGAERTRLIHRIRTISGGLLEIIEFSLQTGASKSQLHKEYLSTVPALALAEYGQTGPMVAPKDLSESAKQYNVILLHKTLEAFLDLPGWNQDLIFGKEPEFTLDGHQLLLRSCGVYMQQFNKALEDTEAEVEFTDERWPFLEYAFKYLPYHARFSEFRTGTSSRILLNKISYPIEYPLPTLSRYSTTQFKYDDSFEDITPLELAFGHGLTLWGRDLLRDGADPNAGGGKPLRNAALSSNVKMIKELFSAGAFISPSHLRANQALVHAAQKGNFDILVLLLDHGADPNTIGPSNPLQPGISTALYEAVRLQSKRMVEYLLQKGADVDIGCFRGEKLYLTPLQQAVSSSNMSMVDLLIERGADVNKVTGHLGGAIQTAKYHGDGAMVERLLAAGAVVQPRNDRKACF